MSESAEAVARAFAETINRHNLDALCNLMTPQHRFVDSMGNVVDGREKMRAAWKGYFGEVPDYMIAIDECYGTGKVVVMLGDAKGTYAPDGKLKPESRWKTPAVFRARIEEGKVADWQIYADNEPIRQCAARSK